MRRSPFLLTAAALAVSGALAGPAAAADFYKGKTIKIIVGYSPGGGYDIYARNLGRYMDKYIPGKPNIIVQNMTGAGSLRAANYIYNRAPKDGTQFGTFSRSLPILALTGGGKNVRFDPVKFTWVGSTASYADDAYLFTVHKATGITSVRELMGKNPKQVTFGSTNFGSTGFDVPLVLKDTLGINIKLVHGYPGGSAINLAITRREMDGRTQGLSSLRTMGDWRAERVPLIQFARGTNRHPDLKDVPTAMELATRQEDRDLIAMLETAFFMARPYAAPPDIPADRKKILRAAFTAAQKDPGYLADAKKLRIDISPKTGEEVDKIVAQIMAMPKPLIARYKSIVENPKAERRKVNWQIVTGTISKVKRKGRLEFKIAGKDKTYKTRMRGRYTKVNINGKKAKRKAVKAGMTCKIWWEGNKSTAGRLDCTK
ncbi:MAG: tripartite tricarboxylate transporter substrate-binding protein [Alphaproteobacteria bacterium]|nr:tripartite tricarboxylate transporter substrate-binding protein [Alphaproteobacteria bacterium]